MKNETIFLFSIFILFVSTSLYAVSLTGKWVAQSDQGVVSLEFLSGNQLNYNGELLPYQIVDDVIQVPGDFSLIDYPYTLKQGKLTIRFPEGYKLTFKRLGKTEHTNRANISNQNSRLQGMLCSYSSSGSYYGSSSSYSSSQRVKFDGQGRFRTNNESSYSGDAGGYYGQGNASGGRYEVKGNQVYLTVDDGSSYQGKVIEQSGGRITGIEVNQTIYGSGLCD